MADAKRSGPVRPEGDAGVVASKAEGVGEAERQLSLDGDVGRVVQVALGVGRVEVDGGGDDAVLEGEHGGDGLGGTGRSEHMPVHTLGC